MNTKIISGPKPLLCLLNSNSSEITLPPQYDSIHIGDHGFKERTNLHNIKPDLFMVHITRENLVSQIAVSKIIAQIHPKPFVFLSPTAFDGLEMLYDLDFTYGVQSGSLSEAQMRITIQQALKHFQRDAMRQAQLHQKIHEAELNLETSLMEHRSVKKLISSSIAELLPEKPNMPGLDIDFAYLPLEEVGGDFIDFIKMQNGKMGIFMSDVTGHGISAAIYTNLIKGYSNRVCRFHGDDPQIFMEKFNTRLYEFQSGLFMSAFYGLINPSQTPGTFDFTYSRAGHPYPILYRKSSNQFEELEATGGLIGINEKAKYESSRISLNPGDRIYIFTDGLTETLNTQGKNLDTPGMIEILKQIQARGLNMSRSISQIIEQLFLYQETARQMDDRTLMGIEVLEPS